MQRIVGLILISLLFFIKRDGYFPFSSSSNPILIYIGNTFLLTIFFVATFFVIRPFKIGPIHKLKRILNINLKYISAVVLAANILGIFILTISAHNSFKDIYTLNLPCFIIFSIIGIAFPLYFLIKQKPQTAIIFLFLTSFLLSVFIIYSFPITAKLSDLMPIVIRQGQALLDGQNIYQYYLLDNGINTQAVRQPGIILLYLPSVVFDFDPRIMSTLYFLGTGLILLKFAYKDFSKILMDKKFYLIFILLSLFLLMPYRFLRADLYEPPFWFIFFLSLYFLFKNKLTTFAILWGIGIFTQVWCWIGTPFVMLYLYKKYGFKSALLTSALFTTLGLSILALFILPNPQSYLEHVFGFYKNSQDQGDFPKVSMFLTPWFFEFGLQKYLQVVQIATSFIIGIVALRCLRTFRGLLIFLVVVIITFIQFLIISWTYMYLNIYFLLILYSILRLDKSNEATVGKIPLLAS